jgi:hypothetical protein
LEELAAKGYETAPAVTKDTVLNMPEYTREEIKGAVRTFTLYMRYPESEYPRIAITEKLDDQATLCSPSYRKSSSKDTSKVTQSESMPEELMGNCPKQPVRKWGNLRQRRPTLG